MLVLSRRQGECIMIGEDIEIKVLQYNFRYNQIKIGITAPKSINIVRSELIGKPPANHKL